MKKQIPFPYALAAEDSPDKYCISSPVDIYWDDVPVRFWTLIDRIAVFSDGTFSAATSPERKLRLQLRIQPPFFFSISVAPDAPAAEPAAATHDWIYSHAEAIAELYGCSVKEVLRLADHWFLSLMRATAFPWSSAYFLGVSLFGYWFHKINLLLKGAKK